MSKFSEYLLMIREGIKNPNAVVEGIINSIKLEHGTLPEDEQAEILRRRVICSECPYTSSNAVSNPALNYRTDRMEEHCILCSCPIATKTAALTQRCGIAVHNKKNPDNQLPLNWDVYQPKTN